MKTLFPAYVVLEIPEPIRSIVCDIRRRLGYGPPDFPVEITVAGSSGVGPVPPGLSIPVLVRELESCLADHRAFDSRFVGVESFPNTCNFYLAPEDRTPFDRLHDTLRSRAASRFSNSRWPYTPHCTLRLGNQATSEHLDFLHCLSVPKSSFTLDTVSIYQLDNTCFRCDLLHQWRLASG